MAKQTFTTGQVLTAAQMTSLQQTAMGGGSATTKTASYTLVAADAGTTVTMTSASATTITVNTALFAAGDTVYIQNLGAGVSTITAGTATVSTSATLALAQYEGGQLYFNSTSAAIFIKGAGAAAGLTSGSATVATDQSTTSATYTDLSTAGPAVTLTTGTKALVIISIEGENDTINTSTFASVAVSGATTIAASDTIAMKWTLRENIENRFSVATRFTTLTAGSNTFTVKYRTAAGTASFGDREIIVIDLGS